ncbi:MAG: RelA/SpoT domain-containing protein [Ornithinimicrobium sp.]
MSAGIEIAGVPTFDDPAQIYASVEDLGSRVRAVHATAADVQVQWCRLAGAYNAPEQQQVIDAMSPPSQVALRLTEHIATAQRALTTYADRLADLDAQRTTLVLDLLAFSRDRGDMEAENADNNAWESVSDHFEREAILMARREDALHDRVIALQVAKDRAENDCVNAIGALWGAPDHHLGGETHVQSPYRYGSTADGYEALARSGQAAWDRPASWTGGPWQVKIDRLDQGGQDALAGIKDAGFDVAGLNGAGRAEASRSGMAQFGKDAWTYGSLIGFLRANNTQRRASAHRLGQVGLASIGYGTWSHDGWHTAGGFLPDAAATYATGGLFAAPRFAGRAALASGLPSGVRLSPGKHAAVWRSRTGDQVSQAQIRLNTWLDTHLQVGDQPGTRPAVAGVAPTARPQSTPPGSLWAMDTGDHAKGSASDAGPASSGAVARASVAGHQVPPVNWGKHGQVGEQYPAQIHAAVEPIINKAIAAEPAVTQDFLTALSEGARAHGLEHRIKSPDSLASKISRKSEDLDSGELNTGMDDVLRYSSVTSASDDLITKAEQTVASLQSNGWTVSRAQHTYVDDNPYKGIHCILRSDELDLSIEVQFHSELSQRTKDETHRSYEISRDPTVSDERRLAADTRSREASSIILDPLGLGSFNRLGGVPVEVVAYPRLRK